MKPELVPAGDAILAECQPQYEGDCEKLRPLAVAMLDLCTERNGVGLAAPQVGARVRMFVMRVKGGRDYVCINPRIHDAGKRLVPAYEGCLTLPGHRFVVERSEHILAEWFDWRGQECRAEFRGLLARIFQHENDHLNGMVVWPRTQVWERPPMEPGEVRFDEMAPLTPAHVAAVTGLAGDAQDGGE